MGLFQVENLTYYFPEKEKPSLQEINLKIEEGDFVFLTGQSGCGKSSLLRALAGLLPDFYGGRIGGKISYRGIPLTQWNKRNLAREIGIIFQDPENQLVMTVVEQEIVFGLENLGLPRKEMRRRVAEVLSLFGLSSLKSEVLFKLAGGEKQKVILAAVLAMQPRVLLLDEPTSQLDPVAAQEFLNYLHRLNQDWGITVVLVEQRIDRCFHLADRVVLMEKGKIAGEGTPGEIVRLSSDQHACFIPPVAQVFREISNGEIPLTVKDGRSVLRRLFSPAGEGAASFTYIDMKEPLHHALASALASASASASVSSACTVESPRTPLLKADNLGFAYPGKELCLRGINLELNRGEIVAVLGENGTGKSTLLKLFCGLLKPQRGRVYLQGLNITGQRAEELSRHLGYLSQNPNDYLFNDTVEEELAFDLKARRERSRFSVKQTLELLELSELKNINPRDLSGGERQRVALGTVLVRDPAVLLLDEPTRGIDMKLKRKLAGILNSIKEKGKGIFLVTHDIEFAAEVADRVVIISDGEIIADGGKKEILSGSVYYAPQVNRLFRGVDPAVMSVHDAVERLKELLDLQRNMAAGFQTGEQCGEIPGRGEK